MKLVRNVVVGGILCTVLSISASASMDNTNGGSVMIEGITDVTPRKTVVVDGGNGEWRYSTSLTAGLRKKITSALDHNTKTHKTTCEIDGNKSDSGWVPKRTTARASAIGPRDSVAYANWQVK